MKNAQIEKDREIRRLEKRFNEEIEEMENLLFEVQQKLADGTKGPLPEGKYWIFMQREEYDDLVQRDEKLSKRITDIENQLQSTEQQIEEQSAAIVHSQPMAMVQSMVNDNHELGYGYETQLSSLFLTLAFPGYYLIHRKKRVRTVISAHDSNH